MRGTLLTVGILTAVPAATAPTCVDGLYLIVARGTNEWSYPDNTGATGSVAEAIAAQIQNSAVVGVDYPATADDPVYRVSEAWGATAMSAMVEEYHSACRGSKIALLGYSQGAQIISDVLCGGAGGVFNHDTPLPVSLVKDSIIAAVLFGDPTHIANTSFDRGTSVRNGVFERNNITICLQYADRMASWCDTGDIFCDSGLDMKVHSSYIQRYNRTMVDFVVERWQNSTASTASHPPATPPRGSPTSTPTGGTVSGSFAGEARFLLSSLLCISWGALFG